VRCQACQWKNHQYQVSDQDPADYDKLFGILSSGPSDLFWLPMPEWAAMDPLRIRAREPSRRVLGVTDEVDDLATRGVIDGLPPGQVNFAVAVLAGRTAKRTSSGWAANC
jgi:hypothetical protein